MYIQYTVIGATQVDKNTLFAEGSLFFVRKSNITKKVTSENLVPGRQLTQMFQRNNFSRRKDFQAAACNY